MRPIFTRPSRKRKRIPSDLLDTLSEERMKTFTEYLRESRVRTFAEYITEADDWDDDDDRDPSELDPFGGMRPTDVEKKAVDYRRGRRAGPEDDGPEPTETVYREHEFDFYTASKFVSHGPPGAQRIINRGLRRQDIFVVPNEHVDEWEAFAKASKTDPTAFTALPGYIMKVSKRVMEQQVPYISSKWDEARQQGLKLWVRFGSGNRFRVILWQPRPMAITLGAMPYIKGNDPNKVFVSGEGLASEPFTRKRREEFNLLTFPNAFDNRDTYNPALAKSWFEMAADWEDLPEKFKRPGRLGYYAR